MTLTEPRKTTSGFGGVCDGVLLLRSPIYLQKKLRHKAGNLIFKEKKQKGKSNDDTKVQSLIEVQFFLLRGLDAPGGPQHRDTTIIEKRKKKEREFIEKIRCFILINTDQMNSLNGMSCSQNAW